MTTEEYINRLRDKYGCQKEEWDNYLRQSDIYKFQEDLNHLPPRSHPRRQYVEARIKEVRETSPTELADRDMARIVDLVKSHLTEAELATVRELHFSQLWTSNLNAMAIRSPSGDRVVLMNRGCMVSFAYASIAFSDCVIDTSYTKAGSFIREDVQLFSAALEPLGGPDVSNHVNVTDIQKRVLLGDPCKSGFADMLVIGMACFVVAHELAHHVLGHQGDLAESALKLDGKTLAYYRYSKYKEYEADRYAWDVFRRVQIEMSRDNHIGEALSMSKFCAVAPLLFMVLIESVQTMRANRHVIRAGETDTHPCGYERRRALEPLVCQALDREVMRFVVGVNFFLYKSVPAFFKGYIPEELSIFVSAPILELGEQYYEASATMPE